MKIQGTCYCQAVKFELSQAPNLVVNCHCSICRRYHGAAFATQALFFGKVLEITSGEDKISEHESTPGLLRAFCTCCGAHFANYKKDKSFVSAAICYLEEDLKPSMHIWVKSKAKWVTINDDLKQVEEMPEL